MNPRYFGNLREIPHKGTWITAQKFTCEKLIMIQRFGKAEKFSKYSSMIPGYYFYNTTRNKNTQSEFAKQGHHWRKK